MENEIVNRVAQSSLVTIALEDYYQEGERRCIDLKNYLYQGLIVREQDIRNVIKETNWSDYKNTHVSVYCSEDVIVPTWAYMLFTIALAPYATTIHVGTPGELEDHIWKNVIDRMDVKAFENAKVVIKGCTKKPVTPFAYGYLATKLALHAQSIMFGEPCSTVPLFKRKK